MFNRKSLAIWLCILAICAANLLAQVASLSGPISGRVFDRSSRSLRPIMGIPGASYLGDPLVAGLDWAAVAPEGSQALALREGNLYSVRGLQSSPAWTLIEGALASPERVAWSGDASVAVLSSSESRLQFLRSLGEGPVAGPPIDLPGRVSALALDRAGGCSLVGVEADQGGGLYLVSPEGPPRLLMPLGRPSAIAVAGNDRDLFVADRANRQIWELRDFREAATPLLFADDGGGMTDAVGLALSRDGKVLFVANQSAKTLDVYTLETRSLASRSSLDYEPSLLEPLSGPVLFLLKSVGNNNEPLLVLDTSREPTVYFVPVGRGE
jgi:hypothetical protein